MTATQDKQQLITHALLSLREQKPLVVNITNYVVMNNTANALLAIGASPIMAHSRQELAEMMSFSGALVINIGTLDSQWIPRMLYAVEQANANNKPVVLDPVGCGASSIRTETSRQIAALAKQLIIRGNASEIIALAGEQATSKGVDALDSSESAVNAARYLVETYQCNVVISGEVDYIINSNSEIQLHNGHAMMPYITGMGCSLSALTSAFAAIGEQTGLAAAAILGIAGELAEKKSAGPGSLQMNLLDVLYQIDSEMINQYLKLTINQ
ncbi:hydroxyethylthiazole kinase [Psychromonas sp.]|uniref:hydroxyethylthiazole kinase n=1 Tax=Psychromonas sp. TaxID=1884585 RepID=UPI003A973255